MPDQNTVVPAADDTVVPAAMPVEVEGETTPETTEAPETTEESVA